MSEKEEIAENKLSQFRKGAQNLFLILTGIANKLNIGR